MLEYIYCTTNIRLFRKRNAIFVKITFTSIMNNIFLRRSAAFVTACACAVAVCGETKTNAGAAYLLSQSKDMSQDFSDLSNTYFFVDSLVDFNVAPYTCLRKHITVGVLEYQSPRTGIYA